MAKHKLNKIKKILVEASEEDLKYINIAAAKKGISRAAYIREQLILLAAKEKKIYADSIN